jgi:hypothetical protein
MKKIEYIQIIKADNPFDIGKVLRIHSRTSKDSEYYSLYDVENGAYRADSCKLIPDTFYDLLNTRTTFSEFLNFEYPTDELGEFNYKLAHKMFVSEWVLSGDRLTISFSLKNIKDEINLYSAFIDITQNEEAEKGNYKVTYKLNDKNKVIYFSSLNAAKCEGKEFILNDIYEFKYNKVEKFS